MTEIELVAPTEENFNEQAYLLANPDVARAVMHGQIFSGWQHFIEAGRAEGRKQEKTAMSDRLADRNFLDANVPMTKNASHLNAMKLLAETYNTPGMKILEIGSREVTGRSAAREMFALADYTGFDVYAGDNVDVVGDAHRLHDYFKCEFDLIYSSAVFEHLALPWVAAEEIAKCLKIGGALFIETHFSFASHERPWHFFQFSDMALKALFSSELGFECVEAGASNPMVGRFSSLADANLRGQPIAGLYCHSEYLGVKRRDIANFKWSDVNIAKVVEGTSYPKPRD